MDGTDPGLILAWPSWACGGDMWAYGNDMEAVCAEARRLGLYLPSETDPAALL